MAETEPAGPIEARSPITEPRRRVAWESWPAMDFTSAAKSRSRSRKKDRASRPTRVCCSAAAQAEAVKSLLPPRPPMVRALLLPTDRLVVLTARKLPVDRLMDHWANRAQRRRRTTGCSNDGGRCEQISISFCSRNRYRLVTKRASGGANHQDRQARKAGGQQCDVQHVSATNKGG